MTLDSRIGLVLEGGGMRGVFTSGVLDFMLDHDINFSYCVGVSAGACNGLSYLSRQRGRAKQTNIDLLDKYQYIGLKHLWTQHSILDQDVIYNKIPNEYLPFDYATCFANPTEFEMVTTSCRTGMPCYLSEHSDKDRLTLIAKASSSLPFVCPIVDVDGEPMLDGGIVDSIPVERAMETGHTFNVVVLTRQRGFRSTDRDIKMPRFIYRNYPRLRMVLSHRHAYYNRQLELIEKLEDEGKILAIRPEINLDISRLENNTKRLTALYEEGYSQAETAMSKFLAERKEDKGGGVAV